MHELSLALDIIDQVSERAKAEGAIRINEIELEIGTLAGVMADSLKFCFETAAANSLLEGTRLKIISVPGQGQCTTCSQEFMVDSYYSLCPGCNGFAVKITQGKDLTIRSFNFDS